MIKKPSSKLSRESLFSPEGTNSTETPVAEERMKKDKKQDFKRHKKEIKRNKTMILVKKTPDGKRLGKRLSNKRNEKEGNAKKSIKRPRWHQPKKARPL